MVVYSLIPGGLSPSFDGSVHLSSRINRKGQMGFGCGNIILLWRQCVIRAYVI